MQGFGLTRIFGFRARSISKELAISLIILLVLFEGILLVYVYNRQSRGLLYELEKKADDYAVNLRDVLVVPIWDFDDEQIGESARLDDSAVTDSCTTPSGSWISGGWGRYSSKLPAQCSWISRKNGLPARGVAVSSATSAVGGSLT